MSPLLLIHICAATVGLLSGFMAMATLFAVASTIYSYLFLRARTIPVPLAWLGVLASVLLVVCLPLEMAGFIKGGWLPWMPMLVFRSDLRNVAADRVAAPATR